MGNETRHRDLVPDVIPYSAAISACGTGHVSQPALRLLDEMRQRDPVPEVSTYFGAISACEKGHMSDSALRLLDEIRHRDVCSQFRWRGGGARKRGRADWHGPRAELVGLSLCDRLMDPAPWAVLNNNTHTDFAPPVAINTQ